MGCDGTRLHPKPLFRPQVISTVAVVVVCVVMVGFRGGWGVVLVLAVVEVRSFPSTLHLHCITTKATSTDKTLLINGYNKAELSQYTVTQKPVFQNTARLLVEPKGQEKPLGRGGKRV